jgi:hypothetical protein
LVTREEVKEQGCGKGIVCCDGSIWVGKKGNKFVRGYVFTIH